MHSSSTCHSGSIPSLGSSTMDGPFGHGPSDFRRPSGGQQNDASGEASFQALIARRQQNRYVDPASGSPMKKLPPVGASRLSGLGADTTNVQPYDQVIKELAVAKQEIARKDEELNQTRLAR